MNDSTIDSLSSAYEKRYDEYLSRSIRNIICTDAANRSRSEAAFRQLSRWLGLPEPKVTWVDSPMCAVRTLASTPPPDLLDESIWKSQLYELFDELEQSLDDVVSPALRDSLRRTASSGVSRSLLESVESALFRTFRDPPRSPLWSYIEEGFGGQLELGWTTYYRFLGSLSPNVYTSECASQLEIWNDIGESCGWWFPSEEEIIACERPELCLFDDDFNLHSDCGPALQYRDGEKVWVIHGVQLPDVDGEIIVLRPHEQTIAEIRGEMNEEVRRIRIERFSWPRYISESGAVCIETRKNDVDGTLESLLRLDDGEMRLLCACRSTGRVYALGVPRDVTTAQQAQDWMAGGNSLSVKRGLCLGAS